MKTTSYFFLLFFVFVIGTSISCKKENTENQLPSLMPLNTGNKWNYETHQENNIGSASIEIGDFVVINGQRGYKLLTGNKPYNITFLVANDTEGNHWCVGGYSDVDTLLAPSMNYKFNATTGESWDYEQVHVSHDTGIFDSDVIKVYCIDDDSTITTPAGMLKCMLFEYSPNDGADVFRNFVCKNVGMVKSEHYEDGSLFSYSILKSYTLK